MIQDFGKLLGVSITNTGVRRPVREGAGLPSHPHLRCGSGSTLGAYLLGLRRFRECLLRRSGVRGFLLGGCLLLVLASGFALAAQDRGSPVGGSGTEALPTDSADLRERAREIQARFEGYREARIPPATVSGPGAPCDERIGRFCLRHGGDDAPIPPEPPEVGLARNETLRDLAAVAERIPGDGWVLAQRVYYLLEAGNIRAAESLVRRCEGPEEWWCDALLGYVLHQSGRFISSDSAFSTALTAMPADVREWYRTPEFVVDEDGSELFEDAGPDARADLWTRLWLLSDPLYLVEGNDRLTAHLARKTLVRIRQGSLTAYGLPFDEDRDLEELNVRYGGEVGYERIQSTGGAGAGVPLDIRRMVDTRRIVGRHPPDDREYLPTSDFLEDPAEIPPGAWTLDEPEPRTGYVAPYARNVRPLAAQVARFRRGDSLLVVTSYRPASSASAEQGSPSGAEDRPPSEPAPSDEPANPFAAFGPEPDPAPGSDSNAAGNGASQTPTDGSGNRPEGPVESGLFLLDWDGRPVHESRSDRPEGVVTARVPDGEYVLGLEVWEEEASRAWRVRQGLRQATLAPGQSAVSDLLFLDRSGTLPESLDEALPRTLPSIRVDAGGTFTVAWEVYGLRPGETAEVTLGFTRGEPTLLQRVGEYLRLVEPEEPVEIRFEDRAPDRLGTVFRALDVDVPSFEPGVYTLNLEIQLSGRTPMVTSRRLVVE